ncbi:pleiotropic drug resistance protein 2-like [Quercus lobata]|uniref:pleiotropic drug resistance protein 2-like n=1 Tax=Quercus lobata TaxID=97700 RepID=UPI001244E1FF|nr:pleiotropic drug resistance protein 2-like [Quercus lobata]
MASALVGDDLARSTSSRRSWASGSFLEVWTAPPDVFNWSGRQEEDEEELRWVAIERLPTYDRLRKGMLTQVLDNGKVVHDEVDVTNLGMRDKKLLMESILKVAEEDNEKFLRRLRDRTDSRVGIEIPKIEARYEHVSAEGDVFLNTIESILGLVHLAPSKKRKTQILKDVSGIVKPSRMTLLLGPPGAGKTTLLHALAGKLDKDLKVSGKVTYCGHEFHEFVPQRTCAYISQLDLHYGEMTVRETLDFSGRCVGVGTRNEMLVELSRREKEAGIKPDPEIDAFMKNTAMAGQKTSLVTDYILKQKVFSFNKINRRSQKTLGLDICADIMVGDEMRPISGGQKKRVTTGEMLVGPAKALLMDEISTGLDSSTTFQICKYMRQMVHIMDVTMVISLLQPAPETFDLFDDIILLSEGQIVYQGPRENIIEFFEHVGFKCPDRKGVADFLQEVTSKKDQEQYWFKKNHPYRYISVSEFAQAFGSFHIGQQLLADLSVPYDKSTFKTTQITIMSVIALTVFLRTEMPVGGKFFGALFFRLPVFYKQRDFLFYPAWAFGLPIWVLRIPLSFMESGLWIILTYYTIGFAPSASRFFRQFLAFFGIHQMALSLFRFIAAVGRTQVVANTLGTFTLLLVFVLGGFIVAKNDIEPWMIWG